ncbi:MAG: hypothetical protein LAT78_11190 [Roseinatronobacter sp.]|jgi:hypothetical protein|nr:hypothetical protein [Roseinatronobacter sp.]
MKVVAVTALYNIGRGNVDGRNIDVYIKWLNKTLEVPLPFVVFLDPEIEASKIALKPGDQIISIPKNDLAMFAHRARVEEILATSSTLNRKDISYQLSDYGMMVMSKIDLMKRAAKLVESDYLLWLDAGLCRFIPDLREANIIRSAEDIDGASMLLNTTYYFSQRQRLGKIPKVTVNGARALMMAGDLFIAHDFVDELEARFRFMVETEWLPNGLWSNEQVALGTLLFRGALPGARILRTELSPLAATTCWLFGVPYFKRRIQLYVWKSFVRDELKIRLTPPEQSYLPGDFPEQDYHAWRMSQNI